MGPQWSSRSSKCSEKRRHRCLTTLRRLIVPWVACGLPSSHSVNTPFLPLSSSRVRLSDALCVMDTSGVMDMVFSAENSTSFASRYKAISLIGFVLEVGFFVNPTIVSLFFSVTATLQLAGWQSVCEKGLQWRVFPC